MRKALEAGIKFFQAKKGFLGESLTPVSNEQAQRRADVCLRCPKNTPRPIWELFAGKAAGVLMHQFKAKREMGLKVALEKDLHVCSACLCVLSLKVHAPLTFIRATTPLEDLQQESPRCWILSEIDEENSRPKENHDNQNSSV